MYLKKIQKLLSSLLVFALIVTLMLPVSAFASAQKPDVPKNYLSIETMKQMQQIVQEQIDSKNLAPFLDPSLQDIGDDQEVTVIVELSQPSVALEKGISIISGKSFSAAAEKNAEAKVIKQQQQFTGQLSSKGIKADFGYTYATVVNAMTVTVKGSQLHQLIALNGVKGVYPIVEYNADPIDSVIAPLMNKSGPLLETPEIWKAGYDGTGIKVGILDTGIDYEHPDLKAVYKGGWNFVDHNKGPPDHYARPRAADDPYETTPLDRPADRPLVNEKNRTFETQHGTHVAGIIAAQGNNPYGIKGIAPKVEIHSYRVLGAYGNGNSNWIIAAINKAVEEKMDIINLSLGNDSNDPDYITAIAINNAMLAGSVAVVSTGNNGPNKGTVGSPGTAAFAISVGNSTIPEDMMNANLNFNVGSAPQTHHLNLTAWRFGTEPKDTLTGTYDVVAVPDFGTPADYDGLDVKGKVALVSRGNIAFVDKIAAAKKAGAVAVIIHNSSNGTNAPGPWGGFLGISFDYIPTFDMSYTDGQALRDALKSKPATVTFSDFVKGTTEGDEINDSSSRGPVNRTLDIKPDVVAPGTNIMSTWPVYGKVYQDADYAEAYNSATGTSMSAPHITGVVALVKQKNKSWSPFDIKVALMNTAKVLNTGKYDVFDQGAGRVQPLAAMNTEALAKVIDETTYTDNGNEVTKENITGSVNFRKTKLNPSGTQTVAKSIRLENVSGTSSQYTVNIKETRPYPGASLAVYQTGTNQTTFNLTNSVELTAELRIPAGAPETKGEYQGYIEITNGTTKLSLPFVAYFGNPGPTGVKEISLDSYHLSDVANHNQTNIKFSFNNDQQLSTVLLWSATEPGPDGNGYIGIIAQERGLKGNVPYIIREWDAAYTDLDDLTTEKIAPDGVYTVDLQSKDVEGNVTTKWTKPLFIKRTAPNIIASDVSVTSSAYQYQGKIEDQYFKLIELAENASNEKYDINNMLHAKYELRDQNNELKHSSPFTLDKEGNFELPLSGLFPGEYKLKLIVDDEAGNHAEKVVNISSEKKDLVGLSFSKTNVLENEPFSVDVQFAATQAVYGGSFNLVYNGKLNVSNIKPSVQFAVYAGDAGRLIIDQKTIDIGNGLKQLNYSISLPEGAYEGGTGSLATIQFSGLEGTYPFHLAQAELTDAEHHPIAVKFSSDPTTVTVTKKPKDPDPNPSGPSYSSGTSSTTSPAAPAGDKLKAGLLTKSQVDGKTNATLKLDSDYVTKQIQDKEKTSIVIETSDLKYDQFNQVTFQLDSSAVKKLQESKKPLRIVGASFEIEIPYEAIADFLDAKGLLSVTLKLAAVSKDTGNVPGDGKTKWASFLLTVQGTKEKLSHPLSIVLHTKDAGDIRKVGAYYQSAKPPWSYLAAGTKSKDNSIEFSLAQFGTVGAAEYSKTFDDILTHWAKNEIEVIASHHLINGKGSTSIFKPNDNVTQAEFATMLDRLLGTGKTWEERVQEKGAWQPITREAMVVLLIKTLKADVSKLDSTLGFKDAEQIGKDAQSAVAYAVAKGFIKGDTKNRFAPKGTTTRASASVLLYRVFQSLQH